MRESSFVTCPGPHNRKENSAIISDHGHTAFRAITEKYDGTRPTLGNMRSNDWGGLLTNVTDVEGFSHTGASGVSQQDLQQTEDFILHVIPLRFSVVLWETNSLNCFNASLGQQYE